jgi:hypothetical protein
MHNKAAVRAVANLATLAAKPASSDIIIHGCYILCVYI